MENCDEEHGGFSNPLDEDSLIDCDPVIDNPLRRKMTTEPEQGKTENKKLKKDGGQMNSRKKKEKNKDGDASGGLLDDGWQKNTAFKTFFIEPKDDKTKPLHIMEIAKLLNNIKVDNYTDLNKAGKNRFKITFGNPKHAENLINSKILTEQFNYKVFVPTMFRETIGNVPPSMSE